MATISKKELCEKVAETQRVRSVLTKKIVQAFLDEVIAELAKGNRLEFREFGVFEPRSHPARQGQNPKTLVKVDIPAKRSVKFKMGRKMKQQLNGADRD